MIRFRFESDDPQSSIATLVSRMFATNEKCWQIVGPHGSGKSTLVKQLIAHVPNSTCVEQFTLKEGQRTLPKESPRHGAIPPGRKIDLVVVDGYEQLGWLARRKLQKDSRRKGNCLLVTSHNDVGFATLYQTRVTPELLRDVADELTGEACGRAGTLEQQILSDDLLDDLLEKHGENLREMLFELYDVWAARHQKVDR